MDPTALTRTPVRIAASSLPAPIVSYRGGVWTLEAAYDYDDGPTRISVPAGYRFDLASVPRILWPLVAPFELSIAAPLLHDFLYGSAGAPPAPALLPPRRYTRREVDRLFRDVMAAEGVAAWRRQLAYLAVRAFGAPSWGRASPP